MANDFNAICPDLCAGNVDLPALDADQDCLAFTLRRSQICGLYFFPSGASDPTDWSMAADWTSAIDNTDTMNSAGKYLVVEGELPAPEKVTVDLPKNKQKTSTRRYTITATCRNLTATNYAFLKALQCGDSDIQIYYETVGGWVFGQKDGASIEVDSIDVDFVYGGGRDDNELANIIIQFSGEVDPERIANPNA
jgi:hypothetical protein